MDVLVQSPSDQQVTVTQAQALVPRSQFQGAGSGGCVQDYAGLPTLCRGSALCCGRGAQSGASQEGDDLKVFWSAHGEWFGVDEIRHLNANELSLANASATCGNLTPWKDQPGSALPSRKP